VSENNKLGMSRRDFIRMSALAAGGFAATRGLSLPMLASAQAATELTYMSPGRDLGVKYDQVVVDTFNAAMKAAGKPTAITPNS